MQLGLRVKASINVARMSREHQSGLTTPALIRHASDLRVGQTFSVRNRPPLRLMSQSTHQRDVTMKILLTCGPSFEPVDGARRLTNMSTGKLGATLAHFLTQAGHEVICLRGEGSTFPGPYPASQVNSFTTNTDLADQLEAWGRKGRIDAVLHAAALCDYQVAQVRNGSGERLVSRKFATRDGHLHLELSPALKVLPRLREWFPQACVVGWKYELAGTPDDAFAKAWKQIQDCQTEACVLNGAAYGEGFAVCGRDGRVERCLDPQSLCECLHRLLLAHQDLSPTHQMEPAIPV